MGYFRLRHRSNAQHTSFVRVDAYENTEEMMCFESNEYVYLIFYLLRIYGVLLEVYDDSLNAMCVDVFITFECIHLCILCLVPRCLFWDVFVM